jgi:small subunit ribosomal protein S15
MSLTIEHKRQVIKDFQRAADDTGSPEVQIALLSERIRYLTDHFKIHIQDHHSRQGLMKLVARRRKLLDYLKLKNAERYQQLIAQLGLRK